MNEPNNFAESLNPELAEKVSNILLKAFIETQRMALLTYYQTLNATVRAFEVVAGTGVLVLGAVMSNTRFLVNLAAITTGAYALPRSQTPLEVGLSVAAPAFVVILSEIMAYQTKDDEIIKSFSSAGHEVFDSGWALLKGETPLNDGIEVMTSSINDRADEILGEGVK